MRGLPPSFFAACQTPVATTKYCAFSVPGLCTPCNSLEWTNAAPPGPITPGLSGNGHRQRALHHQEEFLVLMPVRGMRLTSRRQRRLVHFQVVTGMCQAVQDGPGFVLPILLYG